MRFNCQETRKWSSFDRRAYTRSSGGTRAFYDMVSYRVRTKSEVAERGCNSSSISLGLRVPTRTYMMCVVYFKVALRDDYGRCGGLWVCGTLCALQS